MSRELWRMFNPKTIVLIGASKKKGKVGQVVFENLKDFTGEIYGVNKELKQEEIWRFGEELGTEVKKVEDKLGNKGVGEISGKRIFPEISQLPESVDLAILAIPALGSLEVTEELGIRGVKNFVFYASGFKEIGLTGVNNEQKLLELSEKYKINILGPNCFGFINQKLNLNATFGKTPKYSGKIKFISQSGAIASSIIDFANLHNFGFDEFITLGNKSNLSECDILEYFLEKNENDFAVGMYLESIVDGDRFRNLCKELSNKNHPLFILKPGKNEGAIEAMKSHTGSIAGATDIFELAMKDCGVSICRNLEELFYLSNYYSWNNYQDFDRTVSVITNAGGPGVITADLIPENELELEKFSTEIQKELKDSLPPSASITNPIDLVGDAKTDRYQIAGEILLKSKSSHLLFILTPQTLTEVEETAKFIISLKKKTQKNILATFIGGEEIERVRGLFQENQIILFDFPEKALALAKNLSSRKLIEPASQKISSLIKNSIIENILSDFQNQNLNTLGNIEAEVILKQLGIQTPNSTYLDEGFDKKTKEEIKFPVILKISGEKILHKKDLGGIIKNINSRIELEEAILKIEKVKQELENKGHRNIRIQLQEQIEEGVEIILGIKKDPVFGPVLLFGAGGGLTELIADKNLSFLNISSKEIQKLIEGSKIYSKLEKEGQGISQLINLIEKFLALQDYLNQIKEIEINPIIINSKGVFAVDPKIILENLPKS